MWALTPFSLKSWYTSTFSWWKEENEILMVNVFSLLAKDDHYICTTQQTYQVGHGVLFLCRHTVCTLFVCSLWVSLPILASMLVWKTSQLWGRTPAQCSNTWLGYNLASQPVTLATFSIFRVGWWGCVECNWSTVSLWSLKQEFNPHPNEKTDLKWAKSKTQPHQVSVSTCV